mmetsp:Transcript_43644/g.110529  ORF Transcript_43644/g.110529 Transcript_43644/m.110529 type:complete len:200 (-) Transcript_43644:89-688(-)
MRLPARAARGIPGLEVGKRVAGQQRVRQALRHGLRPLLAGQDADFPGHSGLHGPGDHRCPSRPRHERRLVGAGRSDLRAPRGARPLEHRGRGPRESLGLRAGRSGAAEEGLLDPADAQVPYGSQRLRQTALVREAVAAAGLRGRGRGPEARLVRGLRLWVPRRADVADALHAGRVGIADGHSSKRSVRSARFSFEIDGF